MRTSTAAESKRLYNRNRYNGNKEKFKADVKRWRKENPEKVKGYVLKGTRAFRIRYRALINSFKEKPCADCFVQYPSYVMDFDHVRGRKLFTIAMAIARSIPVKRLKAEIAKCDVVCANCHRERTQKRLESCS